MNSPKRKSFDIVFIIKFTWYFFTFCITHLRWAFHNTFNTKKSDSLACLVGKTAIVTGGNAGIGYATSLLLASRGCKVIIGCRRNAKKEVDAIIKETGNPNITSTYLDLCSLKSVRSFAQSIRKNERKIDILINNAGALRLDTKVSEDGLNTLMHTNYFGPFLLTHLLIEPMKASGSARIVFVSSVRAHTHKLSLDTLNIKDFEDVPSATHMIYANSKICDILAAQEFSRRLKARGIVANSADPGVARTAIALGENVFEGDSIFTQILTLVASPILKHPMDAAQTTFHLAASEKLKNESGELYFRCQRWEKPKILDDQRFVEEIWNETEKLVKLNPNEKLPST